MSVDQISDIEILRDMVKLQAKETERLKAQLLEAQQQLQGKNPAAAEQLLLEIAKLEKQRNAALSKLFGSSRSERDKKAPKRKKSSRKQVGHGRKEQPTLPIEPQPHYLDPAEAQCEVCGKQMPEWKGQVESSEEIDYIPSRIVVRRHDRQKYRCSCGGCIKTAPGPKKLFPKARYSIAFAVHIALKKYAYHMPLKRLVRELERMGLDVSTATLWDYLYCLYRVLTPVLPRLSAFILAQSALGVDETTWRLLKSDKRGHSKKYWVWARCCDKAVDYTIVPSRGGAVAEDLLGDYAGTVICDGYKPYETLAAQKNSKFQLAHCWCHARRDLLPFEDDPNAARTLRVIQWIYRLESRADGKSDARRLEIRQRRTKPLLVAFFKWLKTLKIPPTNDLKKALRYIMIREASLMRFLEDPAIHPDNNGTERALRAIVLGRKNHYGSKSERGTAVAALFYSLIESAQLAGVNPHEYLATAVNAGLAGETIPLPHETLPS